MAYGGPPFRPHTNSRSARALSRLPVALRVDPSPPRPFRHQLQVRAQSSRFWSGRSFPVPDFWERMPLIPFRELCADEMAEVVKKYLRRATELAAEQVRAELERRSSREIGAQRAYRWTGSIQHGVRSLGNLDAYVAESIASSKLVGGRQGGWVVADFHKSVMKPAITKLVARQTGGTAGASGAEGVELLLDDPNARRHAYTSWLNYTTTTLSSSLCLEIHSREGEGMGALPRVTFALMEHLCQ